MFNWLGGSKVDHPMADIRQAREIVAGLPENDASKALDEITYWLESLNRTEGFRPDRRFENIDLLDAAAKNHQRKLAQDYLSTSRQQKIRENRLWNSVSGFWKQLAGAYLKCVEQYQGSAGSDRNKLPVVVARGMRALTLQLKWTRLRYGFPEPRLWSDLARLYEMAEAGGYLGSVIAIYPGIHGQSSVRQEFLKALMLTASSTDGLTPLQQEIAERVVAHFAAAFQLEKTATAGCGYGFDLAAARPPARLTKGVERKATLRYFGAGAGLAQLQQLIAAVEETGAIPQDVNLGGAYGKEAVVGVLKHLAQYWLSQPPARGSKRRKLATRITVVPGLSEICRTLASANRNAWDFNQEQPAESWIVENMSDGGYGAIIPAAKGDWVRIGGLIGVQTETAIYWGIGLIRRVAGDEYQQRRVGIQLLSSATIPVRIAVNSTSDTDREPEPALLLSASPDSAGEVGVVMREGSFNPRDSLTMTVNNNSYLLIPSKLIEGGEDFDWAKFKVMQQAG